MQNSSNSILLSSAIAKVFYRLSQLLSNRSVNSQAQDWLQNGLPINVPILINGADKATAVSPIALETGQKGKSYDPL